MYECIKILLPTKLDLGLRVKGEWAYPMVEHRPCLAGGFPLLFSV